MRIFEWVRSLVGSAPATTHLIVLDALPEARRIAETDRVFCFRNARKTFLSEAGRLPESLEPGERCVVVPDGDFTVAVERNGRRHTFRLEAQLDDAFAEFLGRNMRITPDVLEILCGNALDAVLPTLPDPPPAERLRIKISVELVPDGFRCAEAAIAAVEPEPSAPVFEQPESPADAAEQIRELEKLGGELGLDVAAPEPVPEPGSEQGSPGQRLAEMAYSLERQVRMQRSDAADARGLAMRLKLSEQDGSGDGAGAAAAVPPSFSPVEIAGVARPFTALVFRRTDIDDKLRKYVADTLDASLAASERYRKEYLFRDLRQGGALAAFAERISLISGRLESLPALRHGFSYTKPDSGEIRRRIKAVKAAADAAAGVHNAVRLLCGQKPGTKESEAAVAEAETAARHLEKTLKDAAQSAK